MAKASVEFGHFPVSKGWTAVCRIAFKRMMLVGMSLTVFTSVKAEPSYCQNVFKRPLTIPSISVHSLEDKMAFQKLHRDLENFRDRLADEVLTKLDSWFIYQRGEQNPADVLCSPVCGVASAVLREYLRAQGYQVTKYITWKLNGKHKTPDHTFLVVNLLGQEVIVDPTHKQFFNEFYPDGMVLPGTDILVLSYEKIDEWVGELARARAETDPILFNKYGERRGMGPLPNIYSISDAEFSAHFRQVWDYKNSIFKVDE